MLGTGDQPYGYSGSLTSHDLKRQDPFPDIPMSLPAPQLQTLVHEAGLQGQMAADVPKTIFNQEGHGSATKKVMPD